MPPSRGGFGSRLIRLELTHELNGDVELIYQPEGFKLETQFPLAGQVNGMQVQLEGQSWDVR